MFKGPCGASLSNLGLAGIWTPSAQGLMHSHSATPVLLPRVLTLAWALLNNPAVKTSHPQYTEPAQTEQQQTATTNY